jgi:hypothetical protein
MEAYGFDTFVSLHRAQLSSCGVPEHLWSQIFEQLSVAMETGRLEKASQEVLLSPFPDEEEASNLNDSSSTVTPTPALYTIAKNGMVANSTAILVDHMVSFRSADEALSLLTEHNSLMQRVTSLLHNKGALVAADATELDSAADSLLTSMVSMLGTYTIRTRSSTDPTATQTTDVHFLMDEVGCLVHEAPTGSGLKGANVRIAPFFHLREGLGYSVIWPTEDIKQGESLRSLKTDSSAVASLEAVAQSLAEASFVTNPTRPSTADTECAEDQIAEQERDEVATVGCMCITPRPGMTPLMVDGEDIATRKMSEDDRMSKVQCKMLKLSLTEDFPEGCRQSPELALEAAASIAGRCQFVLAFACGDLVESIPISEGDGDKTEDANYGGYKLSRIHDILSILEKLQNDTDCVLYPSYDFHRFCFHKTEYMQQLVKFEVPILPTIFVSKEDFVGSDSNIAAYAGKVADEYQRQQQCHWNLPEAFGLNEHTVFVKFDGLWCREGVLMKYLKAGSDGEEANAQLKEIMIGIFASAFGDAKDSKSPTTTGIQVQPAVQALEGDSPEYRCYFVGGKLRAVASTYFRKKASDGTDAGYEVSASPAYLNRLQKMRAYMHLSHEHVTPFFLRFIVYPSTMSTLFADVCNRSGSSEGLRAVCRKRFVRIGEGRCRRCPSRHRRPGWGCSSNDSSRRCN